MDTAALKESWAKVTEAGDDVPLYFYSHLFLSHPELRTMFPISMSAQRDKLVGALGAVVSNVEELDTVVPVLEQLGRDHRRFSVVTEHYALVGASLLVTLSRFLGEAWTRDLAATWAEAYGVVAKVMVAAAEQSEDTTPAWWEAEVIEVERRTVELAVVQLAPRQGLDYHPGQSVAVEIPQRPRLWRYFSPANAPREDGSIELHVQPVPGGQVSSVVVRQLQGGDVLKLGSPIGDQLTLAPEHLAGQQDILMVAGGTGLAPFRAVLEQLDHSWRTSGTGPQVHLFHGVRMPWNLYEHTTLSQLAQRPWFDYTPVVSDDPSYPGPRGLVGAVAAQSGDWTDRTAMVCGSAGMARHAMGELEAVGVPASSIRAEQFIFGYQVGSPRPPAGDDQDEDTA